MESVLPILGARRDIIVDVPEDAVASSRAVCPMCGESDILENAIWRGGEHLARKIAVDVASNPHSPAPATLKEGLRPAYRFIPGQESSSSRGRE